MKLFPWRSTQSHLLTQYTITHTSLTFNDFSSSEKNCVICRCPLEKEVEVEVDEEDEEDGETKKVEVTKLYERNGALQVR